MNPMDPGSEDQPPLAGIVDLDERYVGGKPHYLFPLIHLNAQKREILIPVFCWISHQIPRSNRGKLINCDMALYFDTFRAMLVAAAFGKNTTFADILPIEPVHKHCI